MSRLISDGYLAVLSKMHQAAIWGTKGHRYADEIWHFYGTLGIGHPETGVILDYGSGAETLRHRFKVLHPGVRVLCYDPAVPGREVRPDYADMVVCTDVLEHVEPELLHNVLDDIFLIARAGVFLHIALTPASRELPDGRNAHLIVETWEWWLSEIHKNRASSPEWFRRSLATGRKTMQICFERRGG